MKDIILLIISIPVAIAILIFKVVKTIFMVILGIIAVATGQTKESLAADVLKEKAELDRLKERASRSETACSGQPKPDTFFLDNSKLIGDRSPLELCSLSKL